MKNVVILGGGISGLLSAYLLANTGKYKVHLVEKGNEVGGLLRSINYGENGYFDYGAHTFTELGFKEIDEFLLILLPKDEWQMIVSSKGQLRSLTGLMYNKTVQHHSPNIDLRHSEKIDEYIASFFKHLSTCSDKFEDIYKKDAYSYAIYLFGEKIADEVIVPAIMKVYGIHPSKLSTMVMFLNHFTRVVLFEEKIMKELLACKNIASRLGYTDLRNLPQEHFSRLRSFYPANMKNGGISTAIKKIEETLTSLGVQIYTNSTAKNIKVENNSIKSIEINDKKIEIDYLVSSIGLLPLANMLNIDTSSYKYDKSLRTATTHILIDEELNVDELSFIYSCDTNSIIFRITNYINYCKGAIRNGLYPITIETLHLDKIDCDDLEKKIVQELLEYKLIKNSTNIKFIKTEVLPIGTGFPLFSMNDVALSDTLREKIKNLSIKNLISVGILSEEGLFFQRDIIQDLYLKINEKLKA